MPGRRTFSHLVPFALLLALVSCIRPTAGPEPVPQGATATLPAVTPQATDTQLPASTATLFPPPTPLPGPPPLTSAAARATLTPSAFLATLTATPPVPAATPEGPSAEVAGGPQEVLALVNEKRVASGLTALALSPELAIAAQAHAEDCAQHNWGSHIGSDGASLLTRLTRAGYAPLEAGENWANALNGQQAFALWWDETPGNDAHRRNILGPQYKEIGIGVAAADWGYYFVVDFGSR